MTVFAPGSLEFEQDDFAFYRLIVEAFSGHGFGAEVGSRLVVVIVSGEGRGCGQQQERNSAQRKRGCMA
jgi:hypothetical protein